MTTVEEVLSWALPAGSSLVAGESGLGREVTWVATFKTRLPAFEALEGGELALISSRAIKQVSDHITLARIVEELSEAGVAAIAVAGEIDAEAIARATELGMPVISLPESVPSAEVERAVVAFLVNRRAQVQQRGAEIRHHLTRLTMEGRGLEAIVKALAELRSKWAVMQDESFNIQFSFPPPSTLSTSLEVQDIEELKPHLCDEMTIDGWLQGTMLTSVTPPTLKLKFPIANLARIVTPILVRGGIGGYLSLVGREDELDDLDSLALQQASEISSMELVKERAVLEAQARMRGRFLDDLLAGSFTSDQAIVAEARHLGYDLMRPYVAAIWNIGRPRREPPGRVGADGLAQMKHYDTYRSLLSSEIARRQPKAILKMESDGLTVLWPAEQSDEVGEVRRQADFIIERLTNAEKGLSLSCGIGRFYPWLRGLSRSYREAQQALMIGRRLFGPNRPTFFGDLGIYRLIFLIKDAPELRDFYQEVLGPLIEHDSKNKSELVKTLEAYFACGGNLVQAAEALHLHRNTLAYRLNKIREVLGQELEDPEVRLALHLALKVKHTL